MNKEQEFKEMLKLYSKQDLWNRIQEKQTIIEDLQSQLAEKDEEIFFYQNVINKKPETAMEMCELLRPYELKLRENEMYKDRFESLCNHYNQDKISFSIAELEKVKEFFLKEHRDEEMDTDYLITKDAGEIADFLLDQIKQLKYQQINELKGNVE